MSRPKTGSETVALGVRFPKVTLNKIDQHKGYYSRSKFLLKITDEYMNKLENEEENATNNE